MNLRQPLCALLLMIALDGVPQVLPAQSIYAQAVRSALAERNRSLELLLLDVRTGEILANSFVHPASPLAPGSLLKPFVALAYARSVAPDQGFPTLNCSANRCWSRSGHGTLTFPQALAQSCNSYFLQLAGQVAPGSFPFLQAPEAGATPETLIGLDGSWLLPPAELVRAYADMLAGPQTPALAAVRQGMRLAAEQGTARRLGPHAGGVLAKTGTAPCLDPQCRAQNDGLVLAAVPAARPQLLLLVRKRGSTGALAAADAGRILTRLQALHAY